MAAVMHASSTDAVAQTRLAFYSALLCSPMLHDCEQVSFYCKTCPAKGSDSEINQCRPRLLKTLQTNDHILREGCFDEAGGEKTAGVVSGIGSEGIEKKVLKVRLAGNE